MVTPEYYIENGFRFVKPYYHLHNTPIKGRWVKRTVIDILADEFKTFTNDEYKRRILSGSIWLERRQKRGVEPTDCKIVESNGVFPTCTVSDGFNLIQKEELIDLKLIDGDRLFRWDHKHERPIKAASIVELDDTQTMPIRIIEENDDLIVVSKPPFIPVHPVQKYYFNSLVEIMKYEAANRLNKNDWNDIRPCHRLDKLTSGLCLFAKNGDSASKIQSDIQNDKVFKTYVARVTGKLPEDECICKDPVLNIDAKKGKGGVSLKGAQTNFKVLSYNEKLNESVVICKPRTGRTHQIRIHLRNLGCPIIGDPIYSGNGPRSDPTLEKETIDGSKDHKHIECNEELLESLQMKQQINVESLKTGEVCDECRTPLFHYDSGNENVVMCLHAIKYEHINKEWQYEDQMPAWASA